jgi:hypothetical protein
LDIEQLKVSVGAEVTRLWNSGQLALEILKGLQSFSPGLRGTSYPGDKSKKSSTLKAVETISL